MADTAGPVRVYTADEAAAILRCKASWLKEKARRREIPFTFIGGSYRWTDAHLAEIIQVGEHKPASASSGRARPRPRVPAPDPGVPALQARTPRRLREPPGPAAP